MSTRKIIKTMKSNTGPNSNYTLDTNHIKKALFNEIESITKQKGWTQSQVQKETGIGQANYSMLKQGNYQRVSVGALISALRQLGYKVEIVVTPENK